MSETPTSPRGNTWTWTNQTTTTTGSPLDCFGRGHPVQEERAQLLGVRLDCDSRFIAWSSAPERIAGVQITSGYVLVVEVNECDAGFAGDAPEIASPYASLLPKRFKVLVARHGEMRTARTALGRRLWELRARIVAGGERLLSWDEVDREGVVRRGERNG